MKMTRLEQAAKDQIIDILNKQGYPSYSKLLDKLDVKLIDTEKNPDDIAYLDTNTATIYFNPDLSIEQVSMIARHEILHEYLTHRMRAEIFKKENPDYANISHDIENIAADFEISNRGYTEKDKAVARGIILRDKVLQGLVTEDMFPDWQDMSFEEMLNELGKREKELGHQMTLMMKDLGTNPPSSEELQEIEQEAQQASKHTADQSIQQQAQEIANKAKQLKQQQAQNTSNDTSKPFDSNAEKKIDAETAKKAAELKKAFAELRQAIEDETQNALDQDKAARKARDAARYRDTPIVRFTDSLNNFIKRAVATGRNTTWSRFNKKYDGSGILRPGISRRSANKVPDINVYFDVSGSFTSYPEKIKQAEQAIGTLNKYVNRGEIKINLFYVTDKVYSSRADAEKVGMGADGRAIIQHINATKPDNTIIITDSDSDVTGNISATVPGGV